MKSTKRIPRTSASTEPVERSVFLSVQGNLAQRARVMIDSGVPELEAICRAVGSLIAYSLLCQRNEPFTGSLSELRLAEEKASRILGHLVDEHPRGSLARFLRAVGEIPRSPSTSTPGAALDEP